MGLLELASTGSTMGMSSIRAVSGARFVGLGMGAIFPATPLAYARVGFAWAGAAVGRPTSILADGPTRQKVCFFTVEIAVAGLLLASNRWRGPTGTLPLPSSPKPPGEVARHARRRKGNLEPGVGSA
jgi:hypothetical protein